MTVQRQILTLVKDKMQEIPQGTHNGKRGDSHPLSGSDSDDNKETEDFKEEAFLGEVRH